MGPARSRAPVTRSRPLNQTEHHAYLIVSGMSGCGVLLTALDSQLAADSFHALDHVAELEFGRPTCCLTEAAVRGEREPLRWRKAQAEPHAVGHILHSF